MMTNIAMLCILIFLGFTLLMGAKVSDSESHFFDKTNSNALRGFWCLIVILVHTPVAFQNRIQDMIGSFAYIGVTFFFMTSAYGLRLSINKRANKYFWRVRLPKLLIPCWLVNILGIFVSLVNGDKISIWNFIRINDWVQWLLVCYFIFWITYKFVDSHQDTIICLLTIAFSITVYLFKSQISGPTWCPEVFGFVWGILLFKTQNVFEEWMKKGWLFKCLLLCVVAGVIGLSYLKFKPVVFWGDYILKIILGGLITLFMLAVNTRINIGNRVSNFLGAISFEIYLIHGMVFELIATMLPELDSGVFIILSITITVIVSAMTKRVYNLIYKVLVTI